jgi:DNA polymerase delta subunit 1
MSTTKRKGLEMEQSIVKKKIKVIDVNWKRPALQPLDPTTQNVAIQNLEVNYFLQFNKWKKQQQAVIRLFGVNEIGNSIVVFVHGFMPYFYVQCWSGFDQHDLTVFGEALNVSGQYFFFCFC